MRTIKLTMSYDGTGFHGFQAQANALTVQEVLEKAIATVFGVQTRVTAAGRTDAGVHALGQVVSFRVSGQLQPIRIPHALNAVLPDSVVCYLAEEVPDTFHACHDAKSKVYTYTIDNSTHPRVLHRHFAYHVRFPLDIRVMAMSAATLTGTHDFISFMASGSTIKGTVRNLMRLEVEEKDRFVNITAEADGFLYNMIRIIAGTLIEVGRRKRDPDLSRVLAARSRNAAGWTVPAHGLILREVKY